MFSINAIQSMFLILSMLQQMESLSSAIDFIQEHPEFGLWIILLALTSCVGQVCIYGTIEGYGE